MEEYLKYVMMNVNKVIDPSNCYYTDDNWIAFTCTNLDYSIPLLRDIMKNTPFLSNCEVLVIDYKTFKHSSEEHYIVNDYLEEDSLKYDSYLRSKNLKALINEK